MKHHKMGGITMKRSLIFQSILAFIFVMAPFVMADTTVTFTYDESGKLKEADYGDNVYIQYRYDEDGNLVERTSKGPEQYTLAISAYGKGIVKAPEDGSQIDCSTYYGRHDCSEDYSSNTTVTLIAESPDLLPVKWEGDCEECGHNATCTITMDADKSCVAKFYTDLNNFEIYWYNEKHDKSLLDNEIQRLINALYRESGIIGISVDDLAISYNNDLEAYFVPWTNIPFDVTGNATDMKGKYGYFSDPSKAYVLSDNITITCSEDGTECSRVVTRLFGTIWAAPKSNNPPNTPEYISPQNGSTGIDYNSVEFSWQASDPDDNDTLSYNIKVGRVLNGTCNLENDVVAVAQGLSDAAYQANGLDPLSTYCWQVEACDAKVCTAGPVWTFTTKAAPVFFSLSVEVSPEGTGTITGQGIVCPNDCDEKYSENATVTLKAQAAGGYRFKSWSGDCSACTDSNCTVHMDADKSCGAVFEPIPNTPPEVSSFSGSPAEGFAPLSVSFICEGTDSDGSIESYEFDFGDGSDVLTSDSGSVSHTYSSAGEYEARCKVYDDKGAVAVSEPVTIVVSELEPSWYDITEDVNVERSPRTLYDRINQCFFVYLTLTNTSGSDIIGPVRMVLNSSTIPLSDASTPGLDPDGYTEDGKPYFIVVPDGENWVNGESLDQIRLDFERIRKRLEFELRFEQYR